jgi:hypothetical protein
MPLKCHLSSLVVMADVVVTRALTPVRNDFTPAAPAVLLAGVLVVTVPVDRG